MMEKKSSRHARISQILITIVVSTILLPFASSGEAKKEPFTPEERQYWAIQKIRRPKAPLVRKSQWVRNPIDAFILSGLEAKGLQPAPPADRQTLIRRATFDLIGLPPTPEEVEAFIADKSPGAYEKLIDRLLASPHYGERWARHWLDLARYAESEGFKSDETRPHAWRYRDYVIRAFNDDKPYNRFIREQIAGDELWPDDPEARVATAFNRHYPDESNARNLLQRRQEILNDITDTVGSVFLGLTVGCARCHDHKFDPILQVDYYRLQAFFANVRAEDEIVLASADLARQHREKIGFWEEKTRSIQEQMKIIEEPRRKQIVDDLFEKYPPEIQSAVLKSPAERTPTEWLMYYKAKPYMNPDSSEVSRSLKGDAKAKWEALKSELDKFAHLHPGELPLGIGITDAGRAAPKTHTLRVGVYDAPLTEVEPGFLSILDSAPAKVAPPLNLESTGRRTALADWLASPDNPLTARVMANRIWHYHFGQGIVATPSDFGMMGETPTHPKLLDWLASEFIRSGWSIKKMHRLMMTSNTYRQASPYSRNGTRIDPDNKLLWRFSRHRLEGEVIRDASLAVSGLLNPKMEGPSVFPEVPPGMQSRGGWKVTEDLKERNRRSIYIFVRRNTRYPMMEAFDMPDTHESCARRNVTTTAPQALTMLNSKLTLEWARAFAARVLQIAGADRMAQIEAAYRLAYSRLPARAEKETAISFFDRHRALVSENIAEGGKPAPSIDARPSSVDPADAAVLADFCHMLINSNEFVYRN